MKIVISLCILFLLSSWVFAYDAVIKDQYGRVSGYVDVDGDKAYQVDKYGKRGDYIEEKLQEREITEITGHPLIEI